MKERIGKLLGNSVESQLITGFFLTGFVSVLINEGTFHSICRRYLVKYGTLIDLPKGFGIADSNDTYIYIWII